MKGNELSYIQQNSIYTYPFHPATPYLGIYPKIKWDTYKKNTKPLFFLKGFTDLPICNNKNKTKQKCQNNLNIYQTAQKTYRYSKPLVLMSTCFKSRSESLAYVTPLNPIPKNKINTISCDQLMDRHLSKEQTYFTSLNQKVIYVQENMI